MNRTETRSAKRHTVPVERLSMSYGELERIMARARRQRAGELARLIRLALSKVSHGFGTAAGRAFKTRKACGDLG